MSHADEMKLQADQDPIYDMLINGRYRRKVLVNKTMTDDDCNDIKRS